MSSMTSSALFFKNAAQVLTLSGPSVPRRGRDLAELGIVRGGAVLTSGPRIVAVGTARALAAEARRLKAQEVDCRGGVVMPGFVDCHTHLVFAGSRLADYELRIRGRTYADIARAGGGIRFSAKMLGATPIRKLLSEARDFLEHFAAHGTTTVEVKTGYGLDVPNELKTLQAIRQLQEISPVEIVPTLLAAHALPVRYDRRRHDYLDLIRRRLIPAVGRRKLAEFIDCFCDQGAFTVEECREILRVGRRFGLTPRLHCDQLRRIGASRLAVELSAASADHLDFVTGSDIRALGRSDTVATMLPGSNFHLGLGYYAPARALVTGGAALALATDFNPGTSPTLNMQFVLSLACSAMHLTPAEAISAATINAAYALARDDRIGSLEPGKQADLLVMDVGDYREIPYYFAWNHCAMTVKRGRMIYSHL